MRACFLGQNVCALGYGVATLQTPPMMAEEPNVPAAIIAGAPAGAERDISTGLVPPAGPGPMGPFSGIALIG